MKKFAPLTCIALFCRTLSWYPLWMLAVCISAPEDRLLLAMCILMPAGLLCQGIHRALAHRWPARQTRVLALTLLALIPLTALAGVLLRLVTGSTFTAVLLAGATLPALTKGSSRDAPQLWINPHFVAFLTGSVIGAFVLQIAASQTPVSLLPAVALNACGYLLLRNQFMLTRLVSRRATGTEEVPPDIRRSNFRLVLGCLVLAAAAILLREPLIWMIRQIGRGAGELLRLFFVLLTRLTAALGGDAPEAAEEAASDPGFNPPPEGASPLWSLLLLPFIPIVIWFWRQFADDWFFDLREWFGALRDKLRRGRAAEEIRTGAGGEYTDVEEDLRPQSVRMKKQRRSWARRLRQWQKMPDSPEKFDAGYTLMLSAPAWGDALPRPAETPLELCGRFGDTLSAATDDLHAVRYAELPLPESSCADMQSALSAMRSAD